jgi:hypothetical protein
MGAERSRSSGSIIGPLTVDASTGVLTAEFPVSKDSLFSLQIDHTTIKGVIGVNRRNVKTMNWVSCVTQITDPNNAANNLAYDFLAVSPEYQVTYTPDANSASGLLQVGVFSKES